MSLSFLNPLFLIFIPVAFLPVILHLLYKRKPKHVLFSDLRFIQLAVKNVTPKKKIHQWLILLLRCLALLFLCTAFAKPVGQAGSFKKSALNRQVAILLDASYSMQYLDSGQSRFDSSKDFALKFLDSFLSQAGPGNATGKETAVIAFSDRVESYNRFTANKNNVHEFISQLKVSDRNTDIGPALKLTNEFFKESGMNSDCSIIVLSDMAHNMLGKDRLEAGSFYPGIRILFVNFGAPNSENLCIENISLSNTPLEFTSKLYNFGNKSQSSIISLWLNDKKILENMLDLPVNKPSSYETVYNEKITSDIYGNFALQEDNLSADNAFYFTGKPQKQKNVLVIDGDAEFGHSINSESYYLVQALNNSNNFTTQVETPDSIENIDNLGSFDCIFICNVKIFSDKLQKMLDRFTDSDKLIMVFLGDKTDPYTSPEWLSNSIGVLQESQASIAEVTPLKTLMPDLDKFELARIEFSKYYKLSDKGAAAQIKLNNGDPLMIAKVIGNTKVYIFASSADRAWTNMPSKPFYPYFVNSISLQDNGQDDKSGNTAIFVGQPLIYNFDNDVSYAQITTPDGKTITDGILKRNEKKAVYDKAGLPGIYKLELFTENGKKSKYFAVNLPDIANESNLNKIDYSNINKALPKIPVMFFDYAKDPVKPLVNAIEGKELFMEFLLIALLLLGLEFVLANL